MVSTPMMSTSVPSAKNPPPAPVVQVAIGQRTTAGGLEHMRKLGLLRRSWLNRGLMVQFVDSKGQNIKLDGRNALQMPLLLFKAVSSQPELVFAGKVTIPDNLDTSSVKFLIACMNSLITRSRVDPLAVRNDTLRDIKLCSAADALGMGTFTQHIFNTYYKRFSNVVPTSTNIDAITNIRTPQGDKLFSQMAYTIAKKLWDEELENGEDFKRHYLPTNPRLEASIAEWTTKFELKATRHAEFEKREAARWERARKAAETNLREEKYYKEVAALEKKDAAAEAKKHAEKHEKEKAAGASYREKKRNGTKDFTFAEAQYAYKYEGVRVPVKSG
ncbi:hypothetical protein N0V83_010936 [Neocucurbitaria cava]|uniref:Uncharacterized protein n=1 Tax=Neocucurbitaria cava TaxID=798079 RepID=A0A9W9CH86_9PLEO|nr:hypothetical protein N0V83_010936 [Neocucurbitaria cava]